MAILLTQGFSIDTYRKGLSAKLALCVLIYHGHTTILNFCYIVTMQKAALPETRDNDTITRKVCVDGIKLCAGKEWRLRVQ